jgi:hypothetical protein
LLDRSDGYTVVVEDGERCAVDERLRDRLVALGPGARLQLLRVLNRPETQPRTLIGALYPSAEFWMLSDVLIDLEADLPTLEAVVAELRAMVRDDHERPTDRRDPRSERSEPLENVVVMDPDSASVSDDWMAGEFDIA